MTRERIKYASEISLISTLRPSCTGGPKSISLNARADVTVIDQGVKDWGKIFSCAI